MAPSHFSIAYQVSRNPFLNIYQPFSNHGTKTETIACLTPSLGTKKSTNAAGLSLQVYEISSYRTNKRGRQASCPLATSRYINSPFHSPALAQRHQNVY